VLQRRAQVRRTTLPGGKHALPVLPSGTTQPVHEVEPLPQARSPMARIHLYVWSRAEMTHLVEACRRCGSRLLHHLYQLLGCRKPLEQLIFSCLQEEVTSRYALGWTGSVLGLAASLSWFGQRYHWTRRLHGEPVALDRAFRAGVFDFANRLVTNPDGT
jgi:hypothetical protein